MKSRLILMALASFALHCQGQGTLQITFDGPPLQPLGTSYGVQSYYESGMLFTPIDPDVPGAQFGRRKGGGTPPPDWPNNGTAYLQTGLTDSLKCRFLNDSLFGLSSVDLAGYSSVVPDFILQFVGYRSDGSTVTTGLSGSGLNFQTFYFGSQFSGLSRVEIVTIGWSLDNLVVSVPEPGTWALLLAGGLLLWFQRGRRNN